MSWPSDRFGLRWRRPLPLVFLGLSVRPASRPNDLAAVRVNLRAAMAEIDAATEAAKNGPLPSVDEIEKDTWADGTSTWRN